MNSWTFTQSWLILQSRDQCHHDDTKTCTCICVLDQKQYLSIWLIAYVIMQHYALKLQHRLDDDVTWRSTHAMTPVKPNDSSVARILSSGFFSGCSMPGNAAATRRNSYKQASTAMTLSCMKTSTPKCSSIFNPCTSRVHCTRHNCTYLFNIIASLGTSFYEHNI